jgi:hypothetical protein
MASPSVTLSREERVVIKEDGVAQAMKSLDDMSKKFSGIDIPLKEFDLPGWLSTLGTISEHIALHYADS